jgi:hypothetical protein
VRGARRDARRDAPDHDAKRADAELRDSGHDVQDAPPRDVTTRDARRAEPDAAVDARAQDAPAHDAHAGDAFADVHAPFYDAGPGCAVGPSGEPTDLRCTGLYSDWASKTIAPGVRAYTPGLQLWSDGAVKNRWIALPRGAVIDTTDMDEWNFPVGTRIWKEFSLPTSGSDGGVRRIETRLITKLAATNVNEPASSWYLTTYRWTADGESDATELTRGEMDANGLGYEVPDQNDCTTCHWGRDDIVMGFEAVSLAQPNAQGFAMPALLEAGVLTRPPVAGSLTIPGDPTAAAALGFLHVNCGIACHNMDLNAAASGTGFDMRLDVATLGSVEATNAFTTGWNQPAEELLIPGVPDTDLLEACSLGTSAAYYFADHRTGVAGYTLAQMPPIDSHVVDVAGMALLAAWLDEHCDAGVADAATDH